MKKAILLSMVALFILGSFAFAQTPVPIFSWDASSGAWVEETNTIIADATSSNTWNTSALSTSVLVPGIGRFIVLPATPNWFKLPRITWNLKVSQWILISIQYLDYNMHVDMPGDYVVDSLSFHVVSNGGVFAYFNTGGWLTNTDGTNSIPTWAGYKVDDQAHPTTGLPATGTSAAGWYDFSELNTMYTPEEPLTVGGPCYFESTFYIWFGFRVGVETCKGNYTTYADIFIQSDP